MPYVSVSVIRQCQCQRLQRYTGVIIHTACNTQRHTSVSVPYVSVSVNDFRGTLRSLFTGPVTPSVIRQWQCQRLQRHTEGITHRACNTQCHTSVAVSTTHKACNTQCHTSVSVPYVCGNVNDFRGTLRALFTGLVTPSAIRQCQCRRLQRHTEGTVDLTCYPKACPVPSSLWGLSSAIISTDAIQCSIPHKGLPSATTSVAAIL